MNYNQKNVKKNNKRPQSSKEYYSKNSPFYTNPPNYESTILQMPKTKNESFSDFNESKAEKNETVNDEYPYVQKLWQNFGVTDNYQLYFNNMIKVLDEEEARYLILNEKKSLNRFADIFIKLSKEIISRENNIESLQRDVRALAKNDKNYEEEDEKIKRSRDNIIMEIIGLIKALRKNSINVVSYFIKVREIVTYYRKIGKIDMNLINKEYKYSDKYMKKMKTDMNFLKKYPQMNKYFSMNNGILDAFLTNFNPKASCNHPNYIRLNAKKAKIPVPEDMEISISECRYYLFQEDIFDKMNYTDIKTENNNDVDYDNKNIYNNINYMENNNRYDSVKKPSKIIFFKNNTEDNNDYQSMNEPYNIGRYNPLRNTYSANKMLNLSNERKRQELLRIKTGKEFNDLLLNNFQPKKRILNNFPLNDMNFRKPFLTNKIVIEREERKKERNPIFLKRNYFGSKNNSLVSEIKELRAHLEEVCFLNENLEKDNSELKKYLMETKKKFEKEIKERDIKEKKRENEFNNKEKEHQRLYKKMSTNIEELTSDKKNLNEKLKSTKTLMDKCNKENSDKINELENNINDLNTQKEELINIKEQLTKERDELIQNKQNLEEKISQLELEISEDNMKLEQNKNTINENEKKIEEMGQKIDELNTTLDNTIKERDESNKKIEELSNKINEMEITIQNNQENIKNLENLKNQLLKENQELSNFNNSAKIQINSLNEQLNTLNIQLTEKDQQINKLKADYDSIQNDNINLKNENESMKNQINKLNSEIEILKGELKYYQPTYICDFYRGNLFNFINGISERFSLDNIQNFMKESFNLEELNIFEENTYLKGVYPKIITIIKENSEDISGFCSIYYENYGHIGDPLILRIDVLCTIEENWEYAIETIIKFIKENVFFDELKYVIKYMKENGKLKLDEKLKTFFKKRLKCSWKNVINYANGQRTQEICLVKEGDYFNKDVNITNNNRFFELKSLSVLSLYEKNKMNIVEEPETIIELKNKYSKTNLYKYMNFFPIFLLLANNPEYKMNFLNDEDQKLYEIPQCNEKQDYLYPKTQIKELTKMFFNIDNIQSLKENIINFDTNNLLCEEAYNIIQNYISAFSLNYLTMEINLSTHTNYCLNYENYIYNRISSEKIDILRDPETRNYFYLIPTNDEKVFIFISQIGPKLKSLLLDKKTNIYKTLAKLHPKLTNQLLQFSSFNVSKIQPKDMKKVIYIPSFKIDSHLYCFSGKDIDEKGKVYNEKNSSEKNIGAIDEMLKLSFEGDKNIKDSFTIIPVEDKKFNLVIREPFLFGIFNINIIDNSPLQLFYVTKDHWIPSNQ